MTASIDVMLPYYGDAEQFRDAVQSVRAQTFADWRLVCVEDASEIGDASSWLSSLGDHRIVHLRNERNLGIAGNFARCLELVEAPHFVMMGSDDRMLPEHLSVLDEARRRHADVDVLQTGVRVIGADSRAVLPPADLVKAILRPRTNRGDATLRGERFAVSLTRADWAYFPSLMWRTSRARRLGFDSRYEIALDLGLILDIALDGGSFTVLHPITFEYRRHRASASMKAARTGERFAQERAFFLDYAERFAAYGWHRAARVARTHAISRLNAASELPGAVLTRSPDGVRRILSHILF